MPKNISKEQPKVLTIQEKANLFQIEYKELCKKYGLQFIFEPMFKYMSDTKSFSVQTKVEISVYSGK